MVARKLSEIAARLGLTLQGEDADVIGVNTLEGAGPDEVSFLANPKYADQLAATRAGAVIVRPEHAGDVKRALISENPYQDFGRVLELFAAPQGSFSGISPLAFIHPEAAVGEGATVYPFVYIGPHAVVESGVKLFPGVYVGENVRVGKGTTVYPNAVLMAGTHVGEGCILHPGSVLGADGFSAIADQVKDDTSLLDRVAFCDSYSDEDTAEIVQAFVKSFTDKYGEAPVGFNALGYVAAKVVLTAIETAGTTEGHAVCDAMKATSLDCVTGHITFDEHCDPIKSAYIKGFVDGVPTLLKRIDP